MTFDESGVSRAIAVAALVGCSLSATAQVEEDSSAAFARSNAELGAAMGLPAAESTVRTHENGMMSAQMGLEAMKMLVVRQNPDGTLSYSHVGSEAEAQEFLQGKTAAHREEQ